MATSGRSQFPKIAQPFPSKYPKITQSFKDKDLIITPFRSANLVESSGFPSIISPPNSSSAVPGQMPNYLTSIGNSLASGQPNTEISELDYSKFLNYNECLIYIENDQPFADTDGTTHIARIIRDFIDSDRLWYELQLITDSDGDIVDSYSIVIARGDNVVSNRVLQDIQPRQMYSFAPLASYKSRKTLTVTEPTNPSIAFIESNSYTAQLPDVVDIYENTDFIEYPLRASSFVIKDNVNDPLNSTSRSALGSGIYGRYVSDESSISNLLTDPNQSAYRIDCPNAYIVQDKEHGESITVASLHTNRYLDKIIQIVRASSEPTLDGVEFLIRANSIENLVVLWNIVLYRTEEIITQEWLENILAQYVLKYLTDDTLIDSVNGNVIQELPINDILGALGYEGILGDDTYINGWGRGCVSYNYSQAQIITGDTALYSK
ncbi:Hypothetical protein HVR_LOCUS619 [uncultured virus]|nr:Hypothetical protein HVR_LOCUS619 [uncultured virus]